MGSPTAQQHLERMGVLREILDENIGRWVRSGGFVSPSGKSFIGEFVEEQHINVQRILLDEKLAVAAQRAGATYLQETEVKRIEFIKSHRYWCVYTTSPQSGASVYTARVVIAADGALSTIARSLVVVNTPPNSVCSRSFAKAGSHKFRADMVLFY